jgi:adenosine kinase
MKKQALIVGSTAIDIIFSVHNEFKKEIIINDGQVSDVSMMLTANKKAQYFGGTAANIAYGLGIQGYTPILISPVGKDFVGEFNSHLVSAGVDTRVKIYEEEYTANFYAISDYNKDQIGIFQPNTHEYIDNLNISDFITNDELDNITVGIFSPGTGKSILKHMKQSRKIWGSKITLIADPSQILSIFFSRDDLFELLKIGNIFIGNETEIDQLKKITGLTISELLGFGTKIIIETLGVKGVRIFEKEKDAVTLDAFKVNNFVEATGAGDAFRAGFIAGLLNDHDLYSSVTNGMKIAACSVQFVGGQGYKI